MACASAACEFPKPKPAIVAALHEIAAAARDRSLTISLEFHGGTLTATAANTVALLRAVDADNLFTYWQPPYWRANGSTTDTQDLALLAHDLSHLHVYEWGSADDRRSLADGAARWQSVLGAVTASVGAWRADRYAFLEFVRGDTVESVRHDAATLRHWIDELDTHG